MSITPGSWKVTDAFRRDPDGIEVREITSHYDGPDSACWIAQVQERAVGSSDAFRMAAANDLYDATRALATEATFPTDDGTALERCASNAWDALSKAHGAPVFQLESQSEGNSNPVPDNPLIAPSADPIKGEGK